MHANQLPHTPPQTPAVFLTGCCPSITHNLHPCILPSPLTLLPPSLHHPQPYITHPTSSHHLQLFSLLLTSLLPKFLSPRAWLIYFVFFCMFYLTLQLGSFVLVFPVVYTSVCSLSFLLSAYLLPPSLSPSRMLPLSPSRYCVRTFV